VLFKRGAMNEPDTRTRSCRPGAGKQPEDGLLAAHIHAWIVSGCHFTRLCRQRRGLSNGSVVRSFVEAPVIIAHKCILESRCDRRRQKAVGLRLAIVEARWAGSVREDPQQLFRAAWLRSCPDEQDRM